MEVKRWKDYPEIWDAIYGSNRTGLLADFGLSDFSITKVVVGEKPEELRKLEKRIGMFWEAFKAENPRMRDDPKYGIRDIKDVELTDCGLVINVFPCSYRDIRFKNCREDDEGLTPGQKEFLDKRFLVLGASGYIETSEGRYLLGIRSDEKARDGLLETVPQGMVDPKPDTEEDIFYDTLTRELREETGLDASDIVNIQTRGINLGVKWGDFTLISRLEILPLSEEKVKPNPSEHSELRYMSMDEIRHHIFGRRYDFNPVTAALFKGLHLLDP